MIRNYLKNRLHSQDMPVAFMISASGVLFLFTLAVIHYAFMVYIVYASGVVVWLLCTIHEVKRMVKLHRSGSTKTP